MANYYLCMKNGKAIHAVANFSYNMGIGKYSYKENEIVHTQHHIPKWASTPQEFWQTYAVQDRVNSSYKKIELSLQNELSLEENKILLDEFLKKNVGDNYYHSAVIHETDSSNPNAKNIHAHIMICKRREDNLARNAEQFFSRYNNKYPQLGGAFVDNEYWGKKKTLLNLRENWEKLINDTFSKKNINSRVSCKSLEKQKEEALKKQDLLLAEFLDRPPISIESYILKKKQDTLLEEEKEKLEYYHDCKELRDLKNEVYLLRQEQVELALLEEKHKQEENNIVKEEDFKDIYDLQSSIFDIALEKKVIEEQMANPILLYSPAIRLLSDEYVKLELQLETISKAKDTQKEMKIYEIESQIREIEENIKEEDISKKIEVLLSELQENLQKVNQKETIFFQELKEKINDLETTEETEKYYQKFQYKNWESNYMTLQTKRKEASSLRYNLRKIETKLSKENLQYSVYNSLTKGEYGKLSKEFKGIEKQLNERVSMTSNERKRLESKLDKIDRAISMIHNQYKYSKGKNLFIRREHSIKNKYYQEFIKVKNNLEKIDLEISFLKNTILEIPKEKQDEFRKQFKEKKLLLETQECIVQKNTLLRKKKNYQNQLQEHNINRTIFHFMTNGKSTNLIEEYNALDLKLKSINSEEELHKIQNSMKTLAREYKDLTNNLDRDEFLQHKDILYTKVIDMLKAIDIELENIEEKLSENDKLEKEYIHCKGSIVNTMNFTPTYVQAELGRVLYTGVIHLEDEDNIDKRMRREMDFSR